MHEFTTTCQLVDAVLKEAEKHKAKGVAEVQLVVGELTYLEPSQIRYSYQLLAKGTKLKASRLRIIRKPGMVECSQCGYMGPIKVMEDPNCHIAYPTLRCPKCDSPVRIIAGRECIVRRIRLVI